MMIKIIKRKQMEQIMMKHKMYTIMFARDIKIN